MKRHMLKMQPVAQTDERIEENYVVRELATVLRSNGERVLSGETKLALTSSALGRLNEGFQQVQSHFSVNLDSHFLYDFVQKTHSLKLSRGSDTLQGNVNISVFNCLKALEIKRVPLHLITGLQSLRPHLIAIDCHRCLGTLQELFANCGGDRTSEFAWTELISAKLSFNDIKQLDNSLKLLPNLVSLNLSHNLLSDTTGLEYLPQLKHLNLSYNLLKEVPRLSSCAQSRLNYLSLSNNNVESLKGVETYQQLQHLDVTYNCILNHCCLSSISTLKSLQNISLLGNPLCYKRSHRANVVACLHGRCLSEQFCVDGQVLTKQEIAAGKSSTYLNTLCGNESSCPNVNHHLYSPTFEEVFDEEQRPSGSSINLLADTEVEEIVSKQIRKKKPKEGKRVRKMPALRDIIIDYPTHEEDEGCEIVSVSSSLNRTLDRDVEQTKQEIEHRHKQYGESWLVIENNLRVLNAACDVTDQSTAIVVTKDKEEIKSKRISQSSDDIIVLGTDAEAVCKIKDGNKDKEDTDCGEDNSKVVCKEVPVDEMSENEKEEDESADLNPFIVQREKPGTDVLETIMVIITATDIREKHVLTAKTFQRLDLCSIQSVTKFQVNSDDGQERRRYAVRVTFNYMKKDKRERVYRLEDMDSYQSFVRSLEDAMHATTLKNMTFGALQCLKCSSQFSKHVAKQVVLHPSATSNIPMPSSVGSSQGYLNEPAPCIMMCPNCDSQLIVELDENSAFPDTTRPLSTTPTHLPEKYSSPKSTFSTDTIPVKDDFSSSEHYCCNEVIIKAEVHVSDHTGEGVVQGVLEDTPKTFGNQSNGQDIGYPLRRNGSDITILSNPSQSSIVVVQQGKTENVIDDSDPELNSQQDQMVFNIYDGETSTNQQAFLSPTCRSKVGSSSSGSMTGSVCTAREQNLSEAQLKSPPGTPLTSKKDWKIAVGSGGNKMEGSQSKTGTGYGSSRYSFADLAMVDHRIQLYLDMHVLLAQEECLAVVKSAVVPYGEKEWTGLIVLTNLSVHLLKIVGKEGLRVETWLKHVDSHPLLNLRYITSCLGSQGIRLEFTRKNAEGKCYTMMLRDADRTNAFVSFISDKFQETEFGHLQVEFQQNADETMSAIAQQLLGTTNSEACEELLLYMMCHWKGNDEDFEPVSIVVTESHIYVAKENMLFPKPVVAVASTREVMTGQQFTLLSKQSIRDLTNLEQYADQQTEINIKFVNEDKRQETCWSVRAETSASLMSLVEALKTPWERLYEVELHVDIL